MSDGQLTLKFLRNKARAASKKPETEETAFDKNARLSGEEHNLKQRSL
jgi:hypothetical protein